MNQTLFMSGWNNSRRNNQTVRSSSFFNGGHSSSSSADQKKNSSLLLLPTKVTTTTERLSLSVDDGTTTPIATTAYNRFATGQPSRWTAQPVGLWLESLVAATEAVDQQGPMIMMENDNDNGTVDNDDDNKKPMSFAATDHVPYILSMTTKNGAPNSTTIPLSTMFDNKSVCCWDDVLSFVNLHDPKASTILYTRQIKVYAVSVEQALSKNGNQGQEQWWSTYQMLQARFEFTFHRIMEQRQNDHTKSSDCRHTLTANPATKIKTTTKLDLDSGETRMLLDTLYEETIEKIKKLLGESRRQPTMEKVGSGFTLPLKSVLPRMKQEDRAKLPEASKEDLGKFMTAWLRANFTNPYPDDEVFQEMATSNGTTHQVISNWLINARTRKWRPALIKACELGRPADLLLEDALNIFDGNPVREMDLLDTLLPMPIRHHHHQPMQRFQEQQLRHTQPDESGSDSDMVTVSISDATMDCEQPIKRSRTTY